jgi:hypothetical protein
MIRVRAGCPQRAKGARSAAPGLSRIGRALTRGASTGGRHRLGRRGRARRSAPEEPIPNRGPLMHDISMFGLTYMQQISETSTGAGLHIEPGIWASVPPTSDPNEPATVVRMGSIPHGTVILAQGNAQVLPGGPQHIPDNNILPFLLGSPPPANTDFNSLAATFTELNLSTPTTFRFASPGVTQGSGSRPSPQRAASPTPISCSTPSWCNSTSTASAGRTSPSPRCASSERTAAAGHAGGG